MNKKEIMEAAAADAAKTFEDRVGYRTVSGTADL